MRWRWLVGILSVLAYLGWGLRPSWNAISESGQGRDFATYHYAARVASEGHDPYDTSALIDAAKDDHTRKDVHPFFYPPPFLLGMTWTVGRSLDLTTKLFFAFNQLTLVGIGWVLNRWFKAPWWLLAVLLATFTPIPDNCKMGQANLPVLLLAVMGLCWSRGSLVAAAAMAKMSPALYVVPWLAQKRGWVLFEVVLSVIGLSALALMVVPVDLQIHFYRDVLPSFSTGEYNGLKVPIALPANHSIPDLIARVWPGPNKHRLSDEARWASLGATILLTVGTAMLARERRDALGEALMAGVVTVVLLVTPVYTYEHHLVFLLLPIAALATALLERRLHPAWWLPSILGYAAVAWPLTALRWVQDQAPHAWEPWIRESKFIGEALLLVGCVAGAVVSKGGGTKKEKA